MAHDRAPIGPVCSIGIPTFNRPENLAATLDMLRRQTYKNLDIIISDNASPNPDVERMCREAAASDQRIRYFRQPENRGPLNNFEFVLLQASGRYFMWAADDDRCKDQYVAMLVTLLERRQSVALATFETQYETPDRQFDFFPQCAAFYNGCPGDAAQRVVKTLRYVTDNMVYGIFRRDALFHRGKPVTQWMGKTLNEHPLFGLVASKGEIISLPEIGFWKRANHEAWQHAKWICQGGWHPAGPHIKRWRRTLTYHRGALQSIFGVYDALDLPPACIINLKEAARRQINLHFFQVCAGWKPKVRLPTAQ